MPELEINAKVEAFKRNMLEQVLVKCTEPQREFFGRLYPNGVPEKNLISAIELCERTVKKNEAGRI